MAYWILIAFVAAYFLLVFLGSRLVVPFMRFRGFKPPADVPKEIREAINGLEAKSDSQKAYLENVYGLIMEKNFRQWHHTRFRAATRLPRAFVKDLKEIWETRDFVYCTAINYLIYTMLINSKFFKPDDILVRHVFVNFFIHQYLRVNVAGVWVDVDPAGTGIRGKPLGTHLAWFG